MKKVFLSFCAVLVFLVGCDTQKKDTSSKAESNVTKSPFSLSIVPEHSYGEQFGSSIAMAHDNPRDPRDNPRNFYIVLTNVSSDPQAAWEYGNSWGYQTISFELTTADGKKLNVSRREESFSLNAPNIHLVEPGEHHVYAIRLNEQWETHPSLPTTAGMAITFRAIYEVPSTPEAAQFKVWTGRLESRDYKLQLRQW